MRHETPLELQLSEQAALKKDKGPAPPNEYLEYVEDSECEGLNEINHIMTHGDYSSEMNVLLRADTISRIDPLEFPLLGDAMAAGSRKKKGKSGELHGRTPQAPASSIQGDEVLATNLAADLEKAADVSTTGVNETRDHVHNDDPNPLSVRHRSKSRGPKKDLVVGSSVWKKIGKNKRSLSCNNRPLGESDFVPPPQ